ncbi:vesicle coat component [Actinomortierella ambigua]|uniref:Vesicle coat component n=1 Tax=Actinomortierella ambigua TaxID=1343610 RepID=A0A9P6UCV6_9FUNG|nr:vesicle coat component [Actinomortierella ambigua]KAG0269683.1 vesicle coat component [Actinomortierella ambigua]
MTRFHMPAAALLATSLILLTSMLTTPAQAVKFELPGQASSEVLPFCISHFVEAETKVLAKIKAKVGANQKISVEITDDTDHQNQLYKKESLGEDQKTMFTTHIAGDIVACFSNSLKDGVQPDQRLTSFIDLDFDIGSEAQDYAKLAETERLKPLEIELRKIEGIVGEVMNTMEHLRNREERMRNTNESTNERVKVFSTLVLVVLVASGLWQIFYLKRFFKKKRLID